MPLDFDIVTGLSTQDSQVLQQDTALRLAKINADNAPNLNTGNVTLPNVPNMLGSPVSAPQDQRSDLAMKNWLTKSKQYDSDLMSGSGTEDLINAKGTDKYLGQKYGYNPDRDNEDFYAKQQSWYTEIPKALIKFVPLTLAKVGTGLGYVAGLADPTNWGKEDGYISSASDNAIARVFEGLEQGIKNTWMPTFQEATDRNKGFFSRAFTDLNFWTEDTMDAAAFMASAFVPGLALSKIGVGAKTASLMARLGIAAENEVLGNMGFAKMAAYMRNAQSVSTTIDKTLITALNTASEAMWEAKGVRDDIRTSLTGKMNPDTGREYTEIEKNRVAGEGARSTFLANCALLSVSNLWETNLLYKVLGKEGKSATNIIQGALGEAFEGGHTKGLAGFLESKPGHILKAFGEGLLTEGIYEENLQLAVQRTYEDSGKYKGGVFDQLLNQSRDAIMGDDPEAAISIGLGGLIGGMAGSIGGLREQHHHNLNQQALITQLNSAQSNWLSFGDLYKKDANGKTLLDDNSKPILDINKANAVIQNWAKLTDLKVNMDNATSPELANIMQKEAFAKLVKAHINAGIEDSIFGKLDNLSRMSDEQLVQLGYDPSSNTNRANDIIDLKAYARDIIDLNESIDKDILSKPTDNASEFALRKNYLYTLGSRQLALTRNSNRLSETIEDLRNKINNTSGTNLEDDYVDQLNYLKKRVLAQRSAVSALENYELDGSDTSLIAEQEELANLTKQFNDLKNSNKELYNSLTLKDENYQYNNPDKNKNILLQSYNNKIAAKAQLDNNAKSVNNEFYKVADLSKGSQYFKDKINKELDKVKDEEDVENPIMNPEDGSNDTNGKSITVKMKDNTNPNNTVDVELEEGKRYLGQLSKTEYGSKKGLRGTAFNNDNIKIIKINDDGTVTATINDDAPVNIPISDLEDLPAIKKYSDLNPLQRFYIENRNKIFKYRVPVKYNNQTKKWETSIVNGRLSYDKKTGNLQIAYKVGDNVKYVDFNPKYVSSTIDITSLPSDQQIALQEQQKRIDDLRAAQYRLFEKLINNTDEEINAQKELSAANQQSLEETTQRLDRLTNDLDRYSKEFALADQTRLEDRRTKAARVLRIINKLKSEISVVESRLEALRAEQKNIDDRQKALQFMMDEYLNAYDSLLDTNEPVTRTEQDYLEHRKAELESQDKGARYTLEQVQNMLDDSIKELNIVETQIDSLTGYLSDLNDHLKRFELQYNIGELFDTYPNITDLRNYLKSAINDNNISYTQKAYLNDILNKVNRQPSFFYDVRFLQNEIKSTIDTIDRAKKGTEYQKDRINQLTAALSDKQELADITTKINSLKTVFAGLAKQFEEEKAAKSYAESKEGGKTVITATTVEDAKNLRENQLALSEFLTEPPINDSDELEYWTTDKPVMVDTNNPLFKSADSHFPNEVLTTNPSSQRFFKFTSSIDLSDEYYLQMVTADNDVYNIRYTSDMTNYPDDIKFVIVKKTKDGYSPVNMKGEALTNPGINDLVYSSVYGSKELLAGGESAIKWVKDNMAPKNLTDAQIEQKIKDFIQFRNDIKNNTKKYGNQYYRISSKSNGVQNKVALDTQTGLPQQLSVEGRLTDNNPNWNNVDLVVSTLNGQIAGSTSVSMPKGRIAIRTNGSVVQVYNRLLNNDEKSRITRLIKQLTYSFGRKNEYEHIKDLGGKISAEEEAKYAGDINNANSIIQYLSSIIYWDRPISGKTRTKNQFQIDKGFLRRGSGADELTVPFNAIAIEDNLAPLLEGVYHQVANKLINSTDPYRVLDVNNDGELTYDTYDSYKEYLLSSKNRKQGETPVYTNIVERSDNQTLPQLKNVYLNFSNNSENSNPKEESKQTDTKIDINNDTPNKLSGDYNLIYANPKSGIRLSIDFSWTSPTNNKATKISVLEGTVAQDKAEAFGNSLLKLLKDVGIPEETYDNGGKEGSALDRINWWRSQGIEYNLTKQSYIQEDYNEAPKDISIEATIESPAPTVSETPPIEESTPPIMSIEELLKQYKDKTEDNPDDDNYRVAVIEDTAKEDEVSTRKWFESNLPQYPVNFVDNLIKGKYWGQFKEGAIWISTQAEQGTGFHEAFEAVWNSILDPNQQDSLINEFKQRPNYKNTLANTALTWRGLTEDQLVKETLAEEFRNYVINDGKIVSPKGQPKINGFFSKLWNFIKNLFGRNNDTLTIDELFNKINNKGFANTPIRNYDNAVVSFKRIPGITQEVSSQLIEGMTAKFFQKLFQKQQNTDSLFSKKGNAKLINDILTEIRAETQKNWNIKATINAGIESQVFTKIPSDDTEALQMINNLTIEQVTKLQNKLEEFRLTNKYNYRDKLNIVDKFKDSVLPIFYDYLRQYGFVIKSNTVEEEDVNSIEEVENKESTSTDTLGIRDSITIDTRNTATTTVKLLIASLTDDKYTKNNTTRIYKTNDLGLPILVDYDKTLNTLFNELQSISSVYKDGKFKDTFELMMNNLDSKYKDKTTNLYRPGYLWIDSLKRRLFYTDKEGNPYDSNNLKEEHIRLRVAFIKSFSKSKNAPRKLIFGDEGNIYSLDPISSSNSNRIRESWENNAKSAIQRGNDYLKIDNNKIVLNKDSKVFQDLLKSRSLLDKAELLRNLGITFSIPDNTLTTKYATTFGDAALRISEFINNGDITTFDDLFSKQIVNGPINNLLSIELANNSDNLSLQYRNPAGENEYSIVNSSFFTNVLNSLKAVDNISDFIRSNPQYGTVDEAGIKLKTYIQNSEFFRLGGKIFDNNGKKRKNLEYQLISGIAQATEADGDVTSRLKRPDKIIQELYYMLDGSYYTVINSDKSSEFALNFGAFVPMFEFITANKAYTPEAKRIYTNHLIDEVNSLINLKNGIGDKIQYYSSNQRDKKTGNWMLSHFRNIIKDPINIKSLQESIKNNTPEIFANNPRVQFEISSYLDDFIKRQQESLIRTGVIERLPDNTYRTSGLSQEQLNKFRRDGLDLNIKNFSQGQFDNLARYLFVNHQINVREQHKIIYDHPAMYKDLPKRSNGATSTKESIVDSPDILNWMDKNYPRVDGKVRSNSQVQTFKNISYRDVNVVSLFYKDIAEGMYKSMIKDMSKEQAEARIGATFNDSGTMTSYNNKGDLKAYIELNEADAHAMILPDFYRDLLFLSAKWSDGQQRQFNYEMAYERVNRANEDNPIHKPYTKQQIKDGLPEADKQTLSEGNPGYVFPVLKPQYFGPQEDAAHMHTTFLKHSVQPRFYRFFEGSSFEHIYQQAQNSGIDIIGYESGEKVGNVLNDNNEFTTFYNNDGSINSRVDPVTNNTITDLPPIQTLYTKFYGVQVEMAAKIKEAVIRGTQMTKIIMSNLFKSGAALKPEYQSLIRDYNDTIINLTKLGKQELLDKLGLQKLDDGSYITTDLKRLVTTLRDEAVKRDLPSNIVEAFEASLNDSTTGLVYKFDSFSNRDKIDNILNAIVDSTVISQHMNGKPAVQAAVTLTEKLGSKRSVVYLKDGLYQTTNDYNKLSDDEKKTVRIASSDLKFYRLADGKISAMEVLLPHWFKELYHKDVKIEDIDKRLLNIIGFRIPTQGMNSIDNIIVKGFLNPEEGDTIVVPSEIVGKSGSDFDIDKMNLYLPNYKMVNGKPTYVESDSNTRESLENRLIEQLSSILSLPDNYRQLIVPNGAETLKNLEQEIQSLMGISKDKSIPFTELSEWNYMNETRERFLVGKQLVGIGAIHITNHALTQVADTYLTGKWAKDNRINLKFEHNSRVGDNNDVKDNNQLYLSAITTKDGNWISELLSEFLTGFVDAAKDPFVFNLNINPATAGSYFYLLRLGVPISTLAYFHTQPIIIDYIKAQQTNESLLNKINGNELSKKEITYLTLSDYITKAFPGLVRDQNGNTSDLKSLFYSMDNDSKEMEIGDYGDIRWVSYAEEAYKDAISKVDTEISRVRSAIPVYTDSNMKSMIKSKSNNNLDQGQSRQQLSILYDFLDYQQQASQLGDFINAFSYDTARTKNIIENKLQQFKYDKVLLQDFIANPDSILESTFLDEMKKEKAEVPKMFANYFVALHPNATSSFNKIYNLINNDNINMSDTNKTDILNRFQNFFLGHILHTLKLRVNNNDVSINNFYNLLFGSNSFAHQVKNLQNKYPNNKILQELFPIVSTDRSNTDNVKMFTSKLSTYEANTTIESAVNLLEQSETDPKLKEFMNNLAIFSIIQSGVQQSPISYTKILPNELYANLVGQIFDKFTGTPFETDPNIIYKQFFQNNSTNSTIVPSGNKGVVNNAGLLSLPNYYRISGYDYLSKRTTNTKLDGTAYTKAEIDDMRKNKELDKLYTNTLYEKFLDDGNKVYYRPINKLGNRIFATEAYITDTANMTASQIALSDINKYVNEKSYDDTVNKILYNTGKELEDRRQSMQNKADEANKILQKDKDTDLNKTQDDITCKE